MIGIIHICYIDGPDAEIDEDTFSCWIQCLPVNGDNWYDYWNRDNQLIYRVVTR